MGFSISKEFNFCYGHRVYVQKLDTGFTEKGHTKEKCRMIHGHEGKVLVHLDSDTLNEQAMVFDFVNLGFVKDFLDSTLDHRFILSQEDPWFKNILNIKFDTKDRIVSNASQRILRRIPVYISDTDHCVGHNLDVSELSGPEKEFYDGYFLINFVPTSENLAKWLFEAVTAKLSTIDVKLSKITWNETPKSQAIYTG